MKKQISALLCLCFIISALSVMLSLPDVYVNPFAAFDERRNELIAAGSTVGCELNGATAESTFGSIVRFKKSASLEEIYACVSEYSYRLLADSSERMFAVSADADELKALYGELIDIAETEGRLTLSAVVDDPIATSQWELDYLQAYRAWDITTGKRSVTVAVLDSGIYRAHPDFENVTILAGYDAVTRTEGVTEDVNGHGTKVTSIIAAATDNGIGMAGIACGVSILPVRISDAAGYVHSSDFIEAVYYAADSGADIINMSFGGFTYSAMEEVAVQYADGKGCVLISAAGNNEELAQYAGQKAYPASYTGVISVGAIDSEGALCGFSQRNDAVDLVAPGAGVTVANTSDSYEKENGTSFAAAYVTGVAALCLSAIDKGVRFTSEQFLSLAAQLNGGKTVDGYGYGCISAYAALSKINTPLVAGVENGGVYHKNVTITFNRGEAMLDGEEFKSGDTVIISGSHTLVVMDGRKSVTVDFVTDNIPLKYEYSESTDSAVITFTRGSATLDGIPYLSGTAITASGKHYFKLTGPYGNTDGFEFECDFDAPPVFGVENGKTYSAPVRVTVGGNGVLTLNGTEISGDSVIAESGTYALVAATADGKHKRTVYFSVSLPNVRVYTSSVATPSVITDGEYGTFILYNSIISGIRVFSSSNPSATKCFVRTQTPVIGHGLYGNKLVLVHRNGVSVCDRKELATSNAPTPIYYAFGCTASAATTANGFVYYLKADGAQSQLWRLDVTNGKSVLVSSFYGSADMLCADGDLLAAASSDGTVYVFDRTGALGFKFATGTQISSFAFCGNYLCTDNCVYGAASGEKLFSLQDGERVVTAVNGLLITDCSVYDLKGRRRIAVFADRLLSADIAEGFYAVKAIDGMKIEIIDCGNASLNADSAARLFNAAAVTETVIGEQTEFNVYESYAYLPSSLNITDAVISSDGNSIYAISADEHILYTINCKTLAITAQTVLRFKPSSLCVGGDSVYVSFSDECAIFVCSAGNTSGKYISCNHSYIKIEHSDGKLYALSDKGDMYCFVSDAPTAAQTVIKSQNVIDFATDGKYIYAYLKPVTVPMLYKISAADFSISDAVQISNGDTGLYVANGLVFAGKQAFKAETMTLAYTLDSDTVIAYKSYVLTRNGLYFSADGALIGDTKAEEKLSLFAEDYGFYTIGGGRITKVFNPRGDLHTLPTVAGITQGATVKGTATAVFPYGYGYLDGVPYESGTTIENGGRHSLVISLPFGVTKTIDFVIEATINSIGISAEKYIITVNETLNLQVTARPYTYGVVDVDYATDNDCVLVSDDGIVIGAKAGVCTITATTADGNHSAAILITVTAGSLRFDSSYFRADSYNRIVKGIAPGTSVETFLAAAAETYGTVAVRGYNGVTVSAGMIHTGMRAELYDIYENVIDSWELSVTGDIDEDGYVTANDYYTLEKLLEELSTASKAVYAAADTDDNGVVNSFDLLALKEHFLGSPFIAADNEGPTHVVNTTIHILAPKSVAAGTSFTVGLTLTDMKNITAISGLLRFESGKATVKAVSVYGAEEDGFYSYDGNGVYFFTSCDEKAASAVLMTVEFTANEALDVGEMISLDACELILYDGVAASISDVTAKTFITPEAETEILIFNLPNFIFDPQTTEYRCIFPAKTQRVYVGVYPSDGCDIAGNTVFSANNALSFAVVAANGSNTAQYNFECERLEGGTTTPDTDNVFKSNNASVAELTVKGGTLSPSFDKSVMVYYVLCDDPTTVSINARPENENATVSVLPYNNDERTVVVLCTAEDGTELCYTLLLYDKLPLLYTEDSGERGWLWLFCIPAGLVAIFAAGATVMIYKRKSAKRKKKLPQ